MWLSDYFLKKYVEKQYEELSQMPDTPKLQEPSSYRGRNVADEKELEALNREAQAKRNNQDAPKPYNEDKFNKLKEDMKEAKEQLIWSMQYDERGYVTLIKENAVNTKDISAKSSKSMSLK